MSSLTRDLKKGDRVVISRSSSYYGKSDSNPADNVKGTVDRADSSSAYVEWDNGRTNGYRDRDLTLVSEMSGSTTSSELTKTPIIGRWYSNPEWSPGSLAKFRGLVAGSEFGYSESTYGSDVSKAYSSWSMMRGVRLATESELRTLPKSHPDHPDHEKKSEWEPKTGDRVEIIANRAMSSHRIGDIGIVDKLYSGHCTVKVPGKESSTMNGQYFDDLKLLPAEEFKPIFKVGDIVEVVKNESSSCNKVGDVGTITSVATSSCSVKVEGRSGGNGHYFTDLKHTSKSLTRSSSFKAGDTVIIIANTNQHDFSIGAKGRLIADSRDASSRGGYYWNVEGIDRKVSCNAVRECDMQLFTGSTPSSLVWRVKTQKELYDEGYISLGRVRPSMWNSSGGMDKFFGRIIPAKFYPKIEECGSSGSVDLEDGWTYNKGHLTTKPMPWGSLTITVFDSDDEDEDEVDEDPDDGISWFDSSEEEALDKLDKMSKGEAKEVWFEKPADSFLDDYTPTTKRPKLEVEMIPHKSRKIF
jgi:hypothetical protein